MTTARESTQPAVKDQIREFIQENLASVKGVTSFRDDESLMDNGVIDSDNVAECHSVSPA